MNCFKNLIYGTDYIEIMVTREILRKITKTRLENTLLNKQEYIKKAIIKKNSSKTLLRETV